MAYIAIKPIRFDKDYAIGEIVPEGVIDPKMAPRLIGWGKIARIDLPGTPQDAPTGNEGERAGNITPSAENAATGGQGGSQATQGNATKATKTKSKK
jgi:hypothetical protein